MRLAALDERYRNSHAWDRQSVANNYLSAASTFAGGHVFDVDMQLGTLPTTIDRWRLADQ
jgi:hypothetical protein